MDLKPRILIASLLIASSLKKHINDFVCFLGVVILRKKKRACCILMFLSTKLLFKMKL